MKKTALWLLVLSISNWVWAFDAGIELFVRNTPSAGQVERLKALLPPEEDRNFLNQLTVAAQQGQTSWYLATVYVYFDALTENDIQVVRENIDTIYIEFPAGSSLEGQQPLEFEEIFQDGDHWQMVYVYEKKFPTRNDFMGAFIEGNYPITVTYKDATPDQTKTLSLPEIEDTMFPGFADDASVSWLGSTMQLYMPNFVEEVGDYDISIWDIKTGKDILEEYEKPYKKYYYFDGLKKIDLGVDIEYAKPGQDAGQGILVFGSITTIFDFRSGVVSGSGLQINKCTVTAGMNDQDTIIWSGKLFAADANFELSEKVRVEIHGEWLLSPVMVDFPIDPSNPLKKNQFIKQVQTDKGIFDFKYDNRNKVASFSAKKVNLTGLACPFVVTVRIGDFYAATTLDEDIVNNSRPCPYELLMGAVKDLQVQKYQLVNGKTAGNDRFTMQGKFAIDGVVELDDDGEPTNPFRVMLERELGYYEGWIDGWEFTVRNGIYSCSNLVDDDGVLTIRLDFNKATYSISINKAALGVNKGDGLRSVGLDVFGFDLTDQVSLWF